MRARKGRIRTRFSPGSRCRRITISAATSTPRTSASRNSSAGKSATNGSFSGKALTFSILRTWADSAITCWTRASGSPAAARETSLEPVDRALFRFDHGFHGERRAGGDRTSTGLSASTFRTSTRLVQINVVVRDKNGPVPDLAQGDFTITDRGKRREISVFSITRLG